MALVGLLVLSRIGQGAFVDFSFFSADKEGEIVKSIEIEAKTACQTDERSLFFFLPSKFQFENFLRL